MISDLKMKITIQQKERDEAIRRLEGVVYQANEVIKTLKNQAPVEKPMSKPKNETFSRKTVGGSKEFKRG